LSGVSPAATAIDTACCNTPPSCTAPFVWVLLINHHFAISM
ncbi:MAG: hypothetical protein ACI9DE_002026, partial [Halioglobus sp.]